MPCPVREKGLRVNCLATLCPQHGWGGFSLSSADWAACWPSTGAAPRTDSTIRSGPEHVARPELLQLRCMCSTIAPENTLCGPRLNVTASKSQAATRQLDVAIELLLADRDPLAARTLAAAAFGLLSDLVEAGRPGESWREALITDSGLPRRQAVEVLNGASNFLKHADRDPVGNISFDEEENDHLIFFATIECGELGEPLSQTIQAFQIWYLACYPGVLKGTEPARKSIAALPGMESLPRHGRLQQGVDFLAQVRARSSSAA